MGIANEQGQRGEELAATYLRQKGYHILSCNEQIRLPNGQRREIDIVCEKDGVLALVEVKHRKQGSLVRAELAVDNRKRARLREAAEQLMATGVKGRVTSEVHSIRIDVVTVESDGLSAIIRHYMNVPTEN